MCPRLGRWSQHPSSLLRAGKWGSLTLILLNSQLRKCLFLLRHRELSPLNTKVGTVHQLTGRKQPKQGELEQPPPS